LPDVSLPATPAINQEIRKTKAEGLPEKEEEGRSENGNMAHVQSFRFIIWSL